MEKIITISKKEERTDKNGNKFLVLLTNPDKIYVFSSVIPQGE
jgi:hypothetical protein